MRTTATSGVLVALLWASAAPVDARHVELGTITVDSPPPLVYGDAVTFSWQLAKRPMHPSLGALCSQDGTLHYLAELPVVRAISGSASLIVDNAYSSTIPGSLDETRPAACQAWVFDELSVGQQPVVLTVSVGFTENPSTGGN